MSEKYLVQPDLEFIDEVVGFGGDTLKKCFQCATCSVACPIAPENNPFPRKEMIAASWGLKDKLISNGDIWLCHECGDCSELCPRGARPGDVLSAIRYTAINEYAQPKFLANAVKDPKKLPFLIGIPAIWFAILAYITVNGGEAMTKLFHNLFGIEWSHSAHGGGHVIAHADFVSTWFVDMTFVPLAGFVVLVFALALKRFITNIHNEAVATGKSDKTSIDVKGFFQALLKTLPTVLKHSKFSQCEANHDRATAHMMVLYSFIGLFVVTNIFFFVLYVFQIPGPYSQLNPVKWLANISGVALVIGSVLMIKNRLGKKDQVSSYKDWYILGVVLALGVTGLLTEMSRLAGAEYLTYFIYYLHLIAIFNLFAFLPFSKMAHLVYRLTAMTYSEYGNRK